MEKTAPLALAFIAGMIATLGIIMASVAVSAGLFPRSIALILVGAGVFVFAWRSAPNSFAD